MTQTNVSRPQAGHFIGFPLASRRRAATVANNALLSGALGARGRWKRVSNCFDTFFGNICQIRG